MLPFAVRSALPGQIVDCTRSRRKPVNANGKDRSSGDKKRTDDEKQHPRLPYATRSEERLRGKRDQRCNDDHSAHVAGAIDQRLAQCEQRDHRRVRPNRFLRKSLPNASVMLSRAARSAARSSSSSSTGAGWSSAADD